MTNRICMVLTVYSWVAVERVGVNRFSGQPDVAENYQTITYEVSEKDGTTTLVITQSNCPSEEMKAHSEQNWKMVMDGMKKLVEETKGQ